MKKFAASLASSAFLAATASSLSVDSRATNEQNAIDQPLRVIKDNPPKEHREKARVKETPNIFTPPMHDVN